MKQCEKALNEADGIVLDYRAIFSGNLQRGEMLESETSIVIIGDVCQGAKVTAKGNVVILGELNGSATAGIAGNKHAVIVAFNMAPVQIRICDHSSKFQQRENEASAHDGVYLEDDSLCIKNIKKSFFRMLKSI